MVVRKGAWNVLEEMPKLTSPVLMGCIGMLKCGYKGIG
jgi:hypothetical protein